MKVTSAKQQFKTFAANRLCKIVAHISKTLMIREYHDALPV
jgi:hypothetical protein